MRDFSVKSDLKSDACTNQIKFKQFDNGVTIKVELVESGEAVDLTGCTIKAQFRRLDKKEFSRDCTNIVNNTFIVTLDSTITAIPGALKVDFKIIKDNKQFTTFTIELQIQESIGEGNSGDIGGNTEITVDLTDYQKKNDTSLETENKTIVGAINEVNKLCGTIANLINGTVEPLKDDIPKVFLSEGILPTTKTETTMKFEYMSKTKNISGYVEIKCQGNSSMSYPKKNFTLKLYKDKTLAEKLKINFKGWGEQNKFVAKANWIDLTHSRNVVSARLWGDIVKTRSSYANYDELFKTSPNVGAVDGFPIKLYSNGVYQGRYTLNIPKDKWMVNMDDELDTHCILCGENYVSGCFRATANINGSDWTDEIHDIVPVSIKTRWNECIDFVMNSTDEEFESNLGNYFDIESLIDYLLFGIVSCGLDAFGKNQLYLTYDGVKWIASMYDMDSTWGLWWNGSKFVASDYPRESFEDYVSTLSSGEGNLLYIRLLELFVNELKTRYAELRQGALSATNIINRFERFADIIPIELIQEDYASTTAGGKFTNIPSKTTNTLQKLRNYAVDRLAYCDTYIDSLTEPTPAVPCTSITLDKSTLELTTTDAQTIVATVEPPDTTETVVWSVDDDTIATVSNGVVTPLKNGSCVVTATCGGQSASCSVVVSGIVTKYSVENNLINCVNNNTDTTVEEGTSYLAQITANDGYELSSVVISMNGEDITSSCYNEGNINISAVTGNIIITANANISFEGEYVDLDLSNIVKGEKFTLYDSAIDFANQTIYGDIDISTVINALENILSIGQDISNWKGRKIHFYYPMSTSSTTMKIQVCGIDAASKINGNTFKFAINNNGIYVNGEKVVGHSASIDDSLSDVLTLTSVQIGSQESASNATYNLVRIYNSLKTIDEMIEMTTI